MEVMEGKWLYLVMVVAAVVMLWAQSQSKRFKSNWARPVVVLSGLFIFALAITQVFQAMTAPQREGDRIRNREMHYLSATMQTLGEQIGTKHRGASILVVTPEPTQFDKLQARQDIVVNSLNLGLADGANVGAIVHPKPPEGMSDAVEEGMVTAAMLDAVIEANPGHQIILLNIGLPHDFHEMAFWSTKVEDGVNRPRLALGQQSVYELRRAIAAEFIACVVTYKPGYKFDINKLAPELYNEAFDDRYLLVTPENVDALAEEYPDLFLVEEEEER